MCDVAHDDYFKLWAIFYWENYGRNAIFIQQINLVAAPVAKDKLWQGLFSGPGFNTSVRWEYLHFGPSYYFWDIYLALAVSLSHFTILIFPRGGNFVTTDGRSVGYWLTPVLLTIEGNYDLNIDGSGVSSANVYVTNQVKYKQTSHSIADGLPFFFERIALTIYCICVRVGPLICNRISMADCDVSGGGARWHHCTVWHKKNLWI